MNLNINYVDLFAGAGGLSEGFMNQGFYPVSHVEMDEDACATLKTRLAYHHLLHTGNLHLYVDYLNQRITRDALWNAVPDEIMKSVINEEISGFTINDIFTTIDNQLKGGKVDLVIGGPPCQAYSLVGRSRDPNRMHGDKRNFLFRYYAEFLKRFEPNFFLFENVLGLLSAGSRKYLNAMVQLFESIGYSVAEPTILNAADFGVLQKRRRVIIIGHKSKRKFYFPKLDKVANNWQIKKDLFYDLPFLNPGDNHTILQYTSPIKDYLEKSGIRSSHDLLTQHITRHHNERDLEIYSIAINNWINYNKRLRYTDLPDRLKTHNNIESFLDRFKVVDPNGHSHTMVAHISKDGHYYIYPDINQIRSISVREAARIQSFPDNYFFEGGRTSAFRQIGNAVPPLMAKSLANKLNLLMNGKEP